MKETIAVSEVLAPQFVVPVVAVVICALFVFMFGFRSAPEPTFEYDSSDDKKYRKSKGKKKEKTTQSNGHVVNVEPNKATSAQNPTISADKKDVTPKPKQTKKAAPKAIVVKSENAKENVQGEDNSDGWTTAVSKKDKKKSKRRDPEDFLQGMKTDRGPVEEMKIEEEMVKEVHAVKIAKPQEQRSSSKKASKMQRGKAAALSKDDALVVEEGKNVQDNEALDIKADEKVINKIENEAKEAPKLEVKIDDKEQTSKKNKKKKKKSETSDALDFEVATTVEVKSKDLESKQFKGQTKALVKPDESIENQIAEAMRESPSPPATPNEVATSPKKSKKKQKSKKEESTGPPSPIEASQVVDKLSQDVSSSPKKTASGATSPKKTNASPVTKGDTKSERLPVQEESNKENTTAAKTSTSGAAAGDSQATAAVSFDEIGEWQEAKPTKKKKKPRRDN